MFRAVAVPTLTVRLASDDARAFALEVRVGDDGTATTHAVTLARDLLVRLAPGESPEAFVRRCFAFLLEREPKESILKRFDVAVIGHYFPEFESRMANP
jgi:hypothetical protein